MRERERGIGKGEYRRRKEGGEEECEREKCEKEIREERKNVKERECE